VNNNFELRREKHDLIMKDKEVEEQGELQVWLGRGSMRWT
jgi:hypothetical protein